MAEYRNPYFYVCASGEWWSNVECLKNVDSFIITRIKWTIMRKCWQNRNNRNKYTEAEEKQKRKAFEVKTARRLGSKVLTWNDEQKKQIEEKIKSG